MTGSPPLRAALAVMGSVVCFALLVERAGLVPAVIVAVIVAARGSRDGNPREALLLAAGLAVAASVLFVVLLNQPFAIIRGW
jgi:hypothetical protein